MAFVLDTNIAIHLRDRHPEVRRRVGELEPPIYLSVMTRIELEGGLVGPGDLATARLARVSAILAAFPTLPFDDVAADGYRQILAVTGFSRRRIIDRMIAAQCIVQGATLVTMNPDDFRDVPGLAFEAW